MTSNPTKVFAYVPHGWFVRAMALGWEIASPLGLGHHGEFATLMRWSGDVDSVQMPWAPAATPPSFKHNALDTTEEVP